MKRKKPRNRLSTSLFSLIIEVTKKSLKFSVSRSLNLWAVLISLRYNFKVAGLRILECSAHWTKFLRQDLETGQVSGKLFTETNWSKHFKAELYLFQDLADFEADIRDPQTPAGQEEIPILGDARTEYF
jgi:hypothetical protein